MSDARADHIRAILTTARKEPDPDNGHPHVVLPAEAVDTILDRVGAMENIIDSLESELAVTDQELRLTRALLSDDAATCGYPYCGKDPES